MDVEKIKIDIDKLISKGDTNPNNCYKAGYGHYLNKSLYSGFRSSSLSYLKRLLGEDDTFYIEFEKTLKNNEFSNVDGGVSILKSLKEALDNDWLFNMKGLISSEIFSDFMEMAEHLLEEGYKDPSAVMIGSVLEEHLRQLCVKYEVNIEFESKGVMKPKKADTLNADLVKSGAYNKLEQKQITAWLDLRNKSAHGLYDEYDKVQVGLMYQGVLDFMIRNNV